MLEVIRVPPADSRTRSIIRSTERLRMSWRYARAVVLDLGIGDRGPPGHYTEFPVKLFTVRSGTKK